MIPKLQGFAATGVCEMAMRVNPDTGEVGLKQRYRVTNWSEYDRALVNRGNPTIWFDDESLRDSWMLVAGRKRA